MTYPDTAEHRRLAASQARQADWKHWGPYLSERAWGTVREDYSATGEAWAYFPHDHARSRAYRWNEDGLAGVSNRFQNLCLSVALWNERDPILKERLFGLSGPEGNHGEDVKEVYWYLDSTPTHSYMKMLYRYPQAAYPYADLVAENARRTRHGQEFELVDALRSEFEQGRYFDVTMEYAKAGQEDILCRITALNQGPDPALLHILPHIWARNTWSWGYSEERPSLRAVRPAELHVHERHLGERWWYVRSSQSGPTLLFTENETNYRRLFNQPNPSPYVKDAFHEYLVNGLAEAVNPLQEGTKAAAHFRWLVPPGEQFTVQVRLADLQQDEPFAGFDQVFERRIGEADEFYEHIHAPGLDAEERRIQREAFAGLLWTRQFYHYSVELWLRGDPAMPTPPPQRLQGRNYTWGHLYNLDVISMPDKWEYPWYAAWDLAFHTLPLAMVDPESAKRQLILILREWYMHPNGQIPAYEWALDDVNPPVHAWAAWHVYQIDRELSGHADTDFLERVFHKLLLNFTWWVNRKDQDDNNIFQGGFLGLDNIGVFDRSAGLPDGSHIDQADGTAWMAMYCLNMLSIALELARTRPVYEDVATKFFEHFIYIANAIYAMGELGQTGEHGLWDESDQFFYDVLHHPDGRYERLKVRSFVGLIPLFAVEVVEPDLLARLPRFRRRMDWFLQYRPALVDRVASLTEPGQGGLLLLSMVSRDQLRAVLQRMLDTEEFLSPYGVRSLSRYHKDHPFVFHADGAVHSVQYQPADSTTDLFGGNSNWRGPVWFPLNYLMLEALEKYHRYYGDDLQVEVPTGSGQFHALAGVAANLGRRLARLFLPGQDGHRPFLGGDGLLQSDPRWYAHTLFYEYFHGDNGAGLGASHQTGWTALVARLLHKGARS